MPLCVLSCCPVLLPSDSLPCRVWLPSCDSSKWLAFVTLVVTFASLEHEGCWVSLAGVVLVQCIYMLRDIGVLLRGVRVATRRKVEIVDPVGQGRYHGHRPTESNCSCVTTSMTISAKSDLPSKCCA